MGWGRQGRREGCGCMRATTKMPPIIFVSKEEIVYNISFLSVYKRNISQCLCKQYGAKEPVVEAFDEPLMPHQISFKGYQKRFWLKPDGCLW